MEGTIILQFNSQGAYAAVCEFGQAMRQRCAPFALLQEPYTVDGCVRGLPGGMRVFTDLVGDSAIVVDSDDYDCTVLSRSEYGVCIAAENSVGRVLLASIYCRFSAPLEPYLVYMDTVLLLASSSPIILGLDANACSQMWFSKMVGASTHHRNYTRGSMLSEWLVAAGAFVLNEASRLYTFDGPNGCSDIDVTVANGAAMTAFDFRWRVCDNWGVSDHNLIEIVATYRRRTESAVPLPRRWRLNDVQWDTYCDRIGAYASSYTLDEFRALTVDEQVARVDAWMCQANDELLGRCRSTRTSRVKWWSPELDSMRRRARQLRKRFQRARRVAAEDLLQRKADFLVGLRAYKDLIVRVKEDEWRRFVFDNRDDPWGRVYRICRGRNRQTDFTGLQVDNVNLSTWRECADVLLATFFPVAEPADQSLLMRGAVPSPPLESSEVVDSIARVRCRKSPGIDGMTGEMCRNIWKAIPGYLEAIFARCFTDDYFPTAWKSARIVVLLKSLDRERTSPRSYRGISLLPVLGKVLERIMVSRLMEDYSVGVSEYQFGFREGRSVEDAWMHVRRCVDDSADNYVLGIFVDFKGAFDYLSWGRVLERLHNVGCRDTGLWRSYFCDRKACVMGACGTVWRGVSRGCPQGSICGPYLWNLMMDPLLGRLARSYKLCAYADDLLILVEGRSRAVLEAKAEQAMREVNMWGNDVGVQVAYDKTVLMLLKGRLAPSRPPHVRSGGAVLRYVTEVKYLGIVVSERMKFSSHVRHITEKFSAVVGKIRRVLRYDWGLGRRAVRTIYGGLFVACATYGAPVWCGEALSVQGRNRLLACQRIALLACMPVCRTVSTDALQVLLGAAPLDLEVIRRGIAFRLKRGLPLLPNDWVSADMIATMDWGRRKELLWECLLERWRTRWTVSVNGRVTYEFIRSADFVCGRPDFGFGLNLGFLLTGHGSLNAFLHSRGLADCSDCDCGEGAEDWRHVLTTCRYYDDIRSLGSMGITHTGGIYDFSRALEDDRTVARLGEFAREVFIRRRRRLGGVR